MAVDAIVLGAGFAGFAAATSLADAGARVLVLEARPGLGGRATAFTDPSTGERVDNGQHILMGCYAETFRFLHRIGTTHRVRWQTGLRASMIDRRGHLSTLSLPPVPSPLHFLGGVLAWDALSAAEKVSVLRIGQMLSASSPAMQQADAISVRRWLEDNGQAPRLCELFWEPLALAALNQSIDQAAASHFIRVLQRVFAPDPAAAALVLPAVPLDELYAEPSRQYLEARGGDVRTHAPGKIVVDGNRISGVRVRDEFIAAPLVISTVPWFGFAAAFEALPPPLEGVARDATTLASLPIVTVNLWCDRVVMDEPLIGLPGRNFQWVFDRRAIVGGGVSHLSLISSGAETIVSMTNDALTDMAWQELRDALPAARTATLRKAVVVREKRSTFSLAPDAPPRPGTRTPIVGLLLAGDWIETGLPATIESAVVSGHRAAGSA